ncbi:hypothetical protein IQ243_22310 [Nostocales cyanobacterium LEGE 11386]|nr:hypothetical protein [Nostocales cyanobacterium LEGE 11386]
MTTTISSRGLSPQSIMSPEFISTQAQNAGVKVNKHTSPEVAQSQSQLAAGELQIVHATNGRIRIRATNNSFNSQLETISQNLRQHKGVREVATNQQTGSLVVTFDETLLSLPQLLSILQKFDIQLPQVSNVDFLAAWKSLDFWKEQSISFIPLMLGLAVTGGLGIRGLAAIPVYMMTSNATRRMMDYLEPQFLESTGDRLRRSVADRKSVKPAYQKVVHSVIHAIPGRIRFHVPQIAEDRAYGRRLEKLIKTDSQVISVRVNYDAASIAIAYQPGEVAISHWVNLIELAVDVNPSPNPIKVSSQDVSGLWSNMQPAALSFFLAYLANLTNH